MRRLLSQGPPNYAIQGTYKSGLDREPHMSNLSKGVRGFYSPPGRVYCGVMAVCIQRRAKGQCAEARREVVRDLMRYMSRR
jgi:hypothetical protein